MRPSEVVFDEPFGQAAVELHRISRHVSQGNKLILQGPVEPLIDRIVFRSFDPGPIMLEVQILAGCFKMSVEFRSIVSLNILDPAVKQQVQPIEEIPGRSGTVGSIHSGKGNLGMPVNGGENEPRLAIPVLDDGIKTEQKA